MILGTLTLVAIFGMLGLGFDAAYLYHLKRRAQTAADAGAKAASLELVAGSSADTVASAARTEATANGFTNGANGAIVTVNSPPLSGSWAGSDKAVEVIVTQSTATNFMQVLGFSNARASARAAGGVISSPNCIYVLDPSANNAFGAQRRVIADRKLWRPGQFQLFLGDKRERWVDNHRYLSGRGR